MIRVRVRRGGICGGVVPVRREKGLRNEAPRLGRHAAPVNALAGGERNDYVYYNLSPYLPARGAAERSSRLALRLRIRATGERSAGPPDRSSTGVLRAGRGRLPERRGIYGRIEPVYRSLFPCSTSGLDACA